jgi:hypothetical protein
VRETVKISDPTKNPNHKIKAKLAEIDQWKANDRAAAFPNAQAREAPAQELGDPSGSRKGSPFRSREPTPVVHEVTDLRDVCEAVNDLAAQIAHQFEQLKAHIIKLEKAINNNGPQRGRSDGYPW